MGILQMVLFAGGAVVLVLFLFWISGMVRYIPNTRVGVVEKLWSMSGSIEKGLIALRGEAGFQPDSLRGGFHFFFPFQYRIHIVRLVTISQGKISVEVKNNEGRAALAFAQQDAERIKVEAGANAARVKQEADATAERLRLEGEGESKRVEQVGLAQARATEAPPRV